MNQNHNTKLLKKIEYGNPLFNLGLDSLLEKYEQANTDLELADTYNYILDCVEGSYTAESVVFNMISFSTGMDVNPLFLEMETMILKHNNACNI